MTEEEYQIIEDLYMTRWPVEKRRKNSYMRKCDALYHLAQRTIAPGTCIVELGAWHGAGAISLAMGSRAGKGLPVYAIDTFTNRTGWAGEKYCPQDKKRFLSCVAYAGVKVTLIQKDVRKAGKGWGWGLPISLLVWDLGWDLDMEECRLQGDFDMWGRHIVPTGVFAMVEGGGSKGRKPRLFGSEEVMERAIAGGGWVPGIQFPQGHLYTLVKV